MSNYYVYRQIPQVTKSTTYLTANNVPDDVETYDYVTVNNLLRANDVVAGGSGAFDSVSTPSGHFDTVTIGDVSVSGSAYLEIMGDDLEVDGKGFLVLGDIAGTKNYIWIDYDGNMRRKIGVHPSNDTDGDLIGEQAAEA